MTDNITFLQVNSPTDISLQASGQGDILVFKNAILCRAEVNKNLDEVLPDGIDELAVSIGGRPIDVEHDLSLNCGVFTAGRRTSENALSVDGFIWADRFPQTADGMQTGTHYLSIEADADKAKCSICGGEYDSATDYCDHLSNRRLTGAHRTMVGLKAKGGAVTKRPAGTDTAFDRSSLFFVASHEEKEKVTTMAEKEMAKCPRCGEMVEANETCAKCGKSMEASVIAAELAEALARLNEIVNLKEQLQAAHDKLAADLEAAKTDAQKEKETLSAKVSDLVASIRRSALGLGDEDWNKRKEVILRMDDEAFNLMVASISESKSKTIAGVRLPEPVAGGTQIKEPITLK